MAGPAHAHALQINQSINKHINILNLFRSKKSHPVQHLTSFIPERQIFLFFSMKFCIKSIHFLYFTFSIRHGESERWLKFCRMTFNFLDIFPIYRLRVKQHDSIGLELEWSPTKSRQIGINATVVYRMQLWTKRIIVSLQLVREIPQAIGRAKITKRNIKAKLIPSQFVQSLIYSQKIDK